MTTPETTGIAAGLIRKKKEKRNRETNKHEMREAWRQGKMEIKGLGRIDKET